MAVLFFTTALEGSEGSASRPGHSLPPGKDPVPIVEEAGWAPGPVWTDAENLAPTGIRFPDLQPFAIPTELPGSQLYKCHVIYASLFSLLYLNVGEHSKQDCP